MLCFFYGYAVLFVEIYRALFAAIQGFLCGHGY